MEVETMKNDVCMSWKTVSLEKICTMLSGNAWAASKFKDDGTIPIIRIQNLGSNENEKFIWWDEPFDEKFIVKKGDILLSLSGSIKVDVWKDRDALLNQRIVKLIPNKDINPKWFFWQITNIILDIERMGKWALVNNVSITDLKELEIPLPPLATQKRIAEILDAADALRRKDQELLKKYDELAQAIFIDMFGDPVKNEKGWEVKTVSDCIDFMTSGSRGWAQYYSEKGDIFLRINNVGYNELKLRDLMYVKAPFNAEAKRTQVQSGDLLMSITADLGRTCVVPKDFPRAFINQHLAILRLKADFEPDFVSQLFATDYGKNQFKMLNKGGVKAGLNFEDIKSLKFINPPKILQSKYAALLDKLRKMEVQNMFELEKSGRLFECLIQKAFKGELVS
jgi:type I restriction enzyme S subunit